MGAVAAWAGAAGTGVSAGIYLFNFAMTIITLRTYYRYEYECPRLPLASALLRDDTICRAIRLGSSKIHNPDMLFWVFLLLLLLAHLTYTIIFWLTLHPSQHPLRLAYFLPLIHLYRLLKLLLNSLSSNRLQELQRRQKESISLYDALGVALETTPQFVLQFIIASNLGQYIEGSSDPSLQAQKIPTVLIISLTTSLISGTYGATMAMFFVIENRKPFSKRAFISILFGFQTCVAILEKGMCSAALYQHIKPGTNSVPLIVFTIIQFIVAWLFCVKLISQSHYSNYRDTNMWLKIVHSLGLALMTRIIGPTYVLIKLRKSPRFFIWGTLVHIFGEGFCPAFVFLWTHGIKSPCRASHMVGVEDQGNKYLTCRVFLVVTFASYLISIVTTLLVAWAHTNSEESVSGLPRTLVEVQSKSHNMSNISKLATINSSQNVQEMRVYSLFHFAICFLIILCIQLLPKNSEPKVKPMSYATYGPSRCKMVSRLILFFVVTCNFEKYAKKVYYR